WGIRYRLSGMPIRPSRQTEVAYDDCWDCDGNGGYTGVAPCTDVECGYLYGEAGSTMVTTDNLATSGVTTADGGCAVEGSPCTVCAGSGPSLYVGTITGDTNLGELSDQTYLMQLCTNPSGMSGGFHTPFFAVKACRHEQDLTQCPSGGNYTGCGCSANT